VHWRIIQILTRNCALMVVQIFLAVIHLQYGLPFVTHTHTSELKKKLYEIV
jgi:hypothetical protein